ncbi:MAG: AraC family transcriptional regulator [Rhodanobacter sp.]
MQTGAYGERLGRSFNVLDPPTLRASDGLLAVTELRRDRADSGLTSPIGRHDAYLLGLQLRSMDKHELWLDGNAVDSPAIAAGATSIYDLKRDPIAYIGGPFHSLQFYVPRVSLRTSSTQSGSTPVNDLVYGTSSSLEDPVINYLGQSLLPILRRGTQGHQLFVDHVLFALRDYLATSYGGQKPVECVIRGGLAAWQQRKAMDLLRAHVVEGIGLAQVASAVNLSCSAFVRGFKKSAGISPHQWLLQRRIDRAIDLMRERSNALADVALMSGFADQSHFTRTFSLKMGISPGAWRHAACA